MSNGDVESHFLRRRRGVFRNLNSIGSPGVGRSLANLHGRRPGIRRRISRDGSMNRILRYCSVSLALALGFAAGNGTAIRQARAALQRGDFAAAERTLRPEVKARPNDGAALTLLGVALDNQKKFQEAGEVHRRAAASTPNSPDVWNNYANHLLGTGDQEGARKLYLRVVGLDQANFNANVQLARLALKGKKGAEALGYFKHLPANQQDAPNLAPLRVAALYLAGEAVEADHLAARWLAAARTDLGASFSLGVALADAGQSEKAAEFFTQALALAPSDFNVLVNLGVVAWHTGNYQRAREALDAARRQQPQNVDVLYNLSCADQADPPSEAAVALLAQAARLAPERSDVQKLLALATGDLGAMDDSAAAWDRYLKLQPNDDVARRERGLTAVRMGRLEQGLADLRWFVSRHPTDAVGHFALGVAENKDNPALALTEFDRALALHAGFAAAHAARGGPGRPGAGRRTAPRRCRQPGSPGANVSRPRPRRRRGARAPQGSRPGPRRFQNSAPSGARPCRCRADGGI